LNFTRAGIEQKVTVLQSILKPVEVSNFVTCRHEEQDVKFGHRPNGNKFWGVTGNRI
jgi:hypothetical protein